MTLIGFYAFYGCNGLESVIWNAKNCTVVTRPGYTDGLFATSTNLRTVMFGENVKTIPSYTFNGCSGLTGELMIPDSVTDIGERAFSGCSGLTSIEIPNGVTSIGVRAFESCSELESVIWNAKNFTPGGDYYSIALFGECKLKTVTFGAEVKTIPSYVFRGCSGLTSIEIPNGVTSIGESTFASYSGLESVTMGKGVTSIGYRVFYNCSGLESVIWNAENCTVETYSSDSAKNKGLFATSTNLRTVMFGENVKTIPAYIFYGREKLTGELMIPDSVISIGDYAFRGCSGLMEVKILGSGATSIGTYAFQACTLLESVTIGDGVTSIGSSAFYHCSGLESVTIGSGVTSIGGSAFYNCRSLEAVYYKGTPSGWGRIKIGNDINELTGATRYYYSDEKPTAEQWQESENWWHYDEDGSTIVLWTKEEA